MKTTMEINLQCRFCFFYKGGDAGECRRYAPKPIVSPDGYSSAVWPKVSKDDWCGEFSEFETVEEDNSDDDQE